ATNLGNYERAYAYDLDGHRDLLDYGMEQQASIVQDYFLLQHDNRPQSLTDSSHASRYRDVLAAFLADPGYARAASTDAVASAHQAGAQAAPPPGPPRAGYMCSWRFGERHATP